MEKSLRQNPPYVWQRMVSQDALPLASFLREPFLEVNPYGLQTTRQQQGAALHWLLIAHQILSCAEGIKRQDLVRLSQVMVSSRPA